MNPLIFSLSPCTYAETEKFFSKTALSASSRPAGPPRGVPYALIEQIGLTFEFSRCEAQNLENGGRTEQQLLETLCIQNEGVPKLHDTSDLVLSSIQPDDIDDNPGIFRDFEEVLDIELLSLSGDDTYNLSSWGGHSGDICPHRSNDKRQTVCLKAKGMPPGSDPGTLESTHVLRLASAGMRSIFCNVDTERASGVQLSNQATRFKLCDISPALFSPGYSRVSFVGFERWRRICIRDKGNS